MKRKGDVDGERRKEGKGAFTSCSVTGAVDRAKGKEEEKKGHLKRGGERVVYDIHLIFSRAIRPGGKREKERSKGEEERRKKWEHTSGIRSSPSRSHAAQEGGEKEKKKKNEKGEEGAGGRESCPYILRLSGLRLKTAVDRVGEGRKRKGGGGEGRQERPLLVSSVGSRSREGEERDKRNALFIFRFTHSQVKKEREGGERGGTTGTREGKKKKKGLANHRWLYLDWRFFEQPEGRRGGKEREMWGGGGGRKKDQESLGHSHLPTGGGERKRSNWGGVKWRREL